MLGSRAVSSLTPRQLARKRAKDREAQRVKRERNKAYISSLERELFELQNSIQELLYVNTQLQLQLEGLRELQIWAWDYPQYPVFWEVSCTEPYDFITPTLCP